MCLTVYFITFYLRQGSQHFWQRSQSDHWYLYLSFLVMKANFTFQRWSKWEIPQLIPTSRSSEIQTVNVITFLTFLVLTYPINIHWMVLLEYMLHSFVVYVYQFQHETVYYWSYMLHYMYSEHLVQVSNEKSK